MPDEREYRRRAEALLNRAAAAENMADRGRLIEEAVFWHMLALEAAETPDGGGWIDDDAKDSTAPGSASRRTHPGANR